MSQEIGQYRYGGSGCLGEKQNTSNSYKVTTIAAESSSLSTTEDSFRDILIKPENNFSKDTNYYISLTIPADLNYTMDFSVKLINSDSTNSNYYQFLRNITLKQSSTGTNAYTVALYQIKDTDSSHSSNPVRAEVLTPDRELIQNGSSYILKNGGTIKNDELYYRVNNGKYIYYLGIGGSAIETNCYNDISVVASWRHQSSDVAKGTFEFVFQPVENDFNAILIEMTRGAEDYNIQNSLASGDNVESFYGRYLNKNNVSVELYPLTNLIDNILPRQSGNTTTTGEEEGNRVTRIGVWSHPGLLMSINGEEIHVGPSGYYELADTEISSIGVVAKTWNDNFTIDYEYVLEED